MSTWLKDLFDEPIAVATVYGAGILLVMLWAMAMLSRRVRVMGAQVDLLRNEVRLLNEAVDAMAGSMKIRSRRDSLDGVIDESRAVPEATDISWKVAKADPATSPEVTHPGVAPPPRAPGFAGPDGEERTNTGFPPPPSKPEAAADEKPEPKVKVESA